MTAHMDLRDGPSLADSRAREEALFGLVVSLGVAADAAPYGGTKYMTREQYRDSERRWSAHFWSLATSDDEQAEKYREIARRQDRGTE